jgi:hypothetical protein
MKFSEVARRLTGISCPIFGLSWNPGVAKVASARQVLTYLEDRRVLYAPWEVEIPEHCVESILEIRHFLTDQLGHLDSHDEDIAPHLRAMRAACRHFLSTSDGLRDGPARLQPWMAGTPGWMFNDALGELRAVFGIHIAQLSAKFGIDIEDELAVILPAEVNDAEDGSEDPGWHRFGRH